LLGLVLHSDNGKPMRAGTFIATLQSLGVVPSFSRPHVSDDNKQTDMPGYGFAVTVLALAVLLVAALWLFPRTIARKLLSPDIAKPETSASADLWLAMGCALLGLWLLTSALPTLVFDTYALVHLNPGDDRGNIPQSVVYYVVEVAIGLWLVFGAKGFRRLFWWARNAGYKKSL
jgi:hypothetical protein